MRPEKRTMLMMVILFPGLLSVSVFEIPRLVESDMDLHKTNAEHHNQIHLLPCPELEIQQLRDWQRQNPDIGNDIDSLERVSNIPGIKMDGVFESTY
jgi:hypothetical protein